MLPPVWGHLPRHSYHSESGPKASRRPVQVGVRHLRLLCAMRTALLLGSLALGMSACTVSVRPNLSVDYGSSNLIASLQPDRGAGSSYDVGSNVRFLLTTRTAGYVTLVSLDPDGNLITESETVAPASAEAWWREQARKRQAGLGSLGRKDDELPTQVVVRADKAATFGSVRGLMATAQERGFAKFTLVVIRGPER